MAMSDWVAIWLAVLTLVVGLVKWAFNQQVAHINERFAQLEKERAEEIKRINEAIALLFTKHDQDAAKLQELREMVLGEHYRRDELDAKFQSLEGAFGSGLKSVVDKLDELSKVMISHIGEHTGVFRSGAKA